MNAAVATGSETALAAVTQQGDDAVCDMHIVLADTDLSMLSQGSLLI